MISSVSLQKILLSKWKEDKVAHFYILRSPFQLSHKGEFLSEWIEEFCLQVLQWNLNLSRPRALGRWKGGHPDILSLSPPDKQDYKMEEGHFNELIREQFFNPIELSRKIFIVHQAQKIRKDYGNKLLKMLEEPHPQSSIFFLNPSHRPMLPTIESRGIKLNLFPPREKLSNQSEFSLPEKMEQALSQWWKNPKQFGDLLEQLKNHPEEQEKVLSRLLSETLKQNNSYRQLDSLCRELVWYEKSRTFHNSIAERFFGLLQAITQDRRSAGT